MFRWFEEDKSNSLKVDIHSHLLPGIDDGVSTWEEALTILAEFAAIGYERIITTPHIHSTYFLNSAETIRALGEECQERVKAADISIKVDYAAEYMVDNHFIDLLEQPEDLLYFGNEKYVLIETGFRVKSLFLSDALFMMHSKGYQPILAHPERYEYLDLDMIFANEVKEQGVKLQVSGMSLEGYYGSTVRSKARMLIKNGLADFIASDMHRITQMDVFKKSLKQKLLNNGFLNNQLL